MKNSNFKIPLNFDNFFPQELDNVLETNRFTPTIGKSGSLKESIDDFIELIITTHLGEYKYDVGFGFEIWEKEFENIQIEKFNTHNYPRRDLEQSLKAKIEKYESRLRQVRVEIIFVYKKIFKGKSIKYFVDINVKGELDNKTRDNYMRSFQFAMGPFFK